jgi:hypothetical protein
MLAFKHFLKHSVPLNQLTFKASVSATCKFGEKVHVKKFTKLILTKKLNSLAKTVHENQRKFEVLYL